MNTYKFDELNIGKEVDFTHTFSSDDMDQFSNLTGDHNPLHADEEYAQTTEFKGTVVHGMLAGSLFSTLVGMYLPGKYCLFLSLDMQFHNPVKPGQEVVVYGKIINKIDSLKILEIEAKITDKDDKKLIPALIKVKVLK